MTIASSDMIGTAVSNARRVCFELSEFLKAHLCPKSCDRDHGSAKDLHPDDEPIGARTFSSLNAVIVGESGSPRPQFHKHKCDDGSQSNEDIHFLCTQQRKWPEAIVSYS